MRKLLTFFLAFGLCATAYAATFKATLTWADNSTDEDGFRIERSANPPATWAEIGSVGPDIVSFVDQPINPGETFCWRIIAFNVAGSSAPSAEVCAAAPSTPGAPGTVQVIITLGP